MNKWRLSQSALGSFLTCKRQFLLSRLWSLKDEHAPVYFAFGRKVHSLMEQGIPTHNNPTPRRIDTKAKPSAAVQIARRLKGMEDGLGIIVDKRELIEDIDVGGAKFRRVIDGVGKDKDGLLLVDYKTASWAWDVIETPKGYIAPKAHTIQTPAYLYEQEAKRMVYLVAPSKNKKDQSFYVEHDPEREQYFLDVVDDVVSCKTFPANYGFNCKFCTMMDVCFETNGWREKYDSRDGE